MLKRYRRIWFSATAILLVVLLAYVAEPVAQLLQAYLFFGSPRNQHINSMIVEQKVSVGMPKKQVLKVLNLPKDTMTTCTIPSSDGGTEVEIVGSSPPWRHLHAGYHTIVIRFDSNGRVVNGECTWWDSDSADCDMLQFRSDSR